MSTELLTRRMDLIHTYDGTAHKLTMDTSYPAKLSGIVTKVFRASTNYSDASVDDETDLFFVYGPEDQIITTIKKKNVLDFQGNSLGNDAFLEDDYVVAIIDITGEMLFLFSTRPTGESSIIATDPYEMNIIYKCNGVNDNVILQELVNLIMDLYTTDPTELDESGGEYSIKMTEDERKEIFNNTKFTIHIVGKFGIDYSKTTFTYRPQDSNRESRSSIMEFASPYYYNHSNIRESYNRNVEMILDFEKCFVPEIEYTKETFAALYNTKLSYSTVSSNGMTSGIYYYDYFTKQNQAHFVDPRNNKPYGNIFPRRLVFIAIDSYHPVNFTIKNLSLTTFGVGIYCNNVESNKTIKIQDCSFSCINAKRNIGIEIVPDPAYYEDISSETSLLHESYRTMLVTPTAIDINCYDATVIVDSCKIKNIKGHLCDTLIMNSCKDMRIVNCDIHGVNQFEDEYQVAYLTEYLDYDYSPDCNYDPFENSSFENINIQRAYRKNHNYMEVMILRQLFYCNRNGFSYPSKFMGNYLGFYANHHGCYGNAIGLAFDNVDDNVLAVDLSATYSGVMKCRVIKQYAGKNTPFPTLPEVDSNLFTSDINTKCLGVIKNIPIIKSYNVREYNNDISGGYQDIIRSHTENIVERFGVALSGDCSNNNANGQVNIANGDGTLNTDNSNIESKFQPNMFITSSNIESDGILYMNAGTVKIANSKITSKVIDAGYAPNQITVLNGELTLESCICDFKTDSIVGSCNINEWYNSGINDSRLAFIHVVPSIYHSGIYILNKYNKRSTNYNTTPVDVRVMSTPKLNVSNCNMTTYIDKRFNYINHNHITGSSSTVCLNNTSVGKRQVNTVLCGFNKFTDVPTSVTTSDKIFLNYFNPITDPVINIESSNFYTMNNFGREEDLGFSNTPNTINSGTYFYPKAENIMDADSSYKFNEAIFSLNSVTVPYYLGEFMESSELSTIFRVGKSIVDKVNKCTYTNSLNDKENAMVYNGSLENLYELVDIPVGTGEDDGVFIDGEKHTGGKQAIRYMYTKNINVIYDIERVCNKDQAIDVAYRTATSSEELDKLVRMVKKEAVLHMYYLDIENGVLYDVISDLKVAEKQSNRDSVDESYCYNIFREIKQYTPSNLYENVKQYGCTLYQYISSDSGVTKDDGSNFTFGNCEGFYYKLARHLDNDNADADYVYNGIRIDDENRLYYRKKVEGTDNTYYNCYLDDDSIEDHVYIAEIYPCDLPHTGYYIYKRLTDYEYTTDEDKGKLEINTIFNSGFESKFHLSRCTFNMNNCNIGGISKTSLRNTNAGELLVKRTPRICFSLDNSGRYNISNTTAYAWGTVLWSTMTDDMKSIHNSQDGYRYNSKQHNGGFNGIDTYINKTTMTLQNSSEIKVNGCFFMNYSGLRNTFSNDDKIQAITGTTEADNSNTIVPIRLYLDTERDKPNIAQDISTRFVYSTKNINDITSYTNPYINGMQYALDGYARYNETVFNGNEMPLMFLFNNKIVDINIVDSSLIGNQTLLMGGNLNIRGSSIVNNGNALVLYTFPDTKYTLIDNKIEATKDVINDKYVDHDRRKICIYSYGTTVGQGANGTISVGTIINKVLQQTFLDDDTRCGNIITNNNIVAIYSQSKQGIIENNEVLFRCNSYAKGYGIDKGTKVRFFQNVPSRQLQSIGSSPTDYVFDKKNNTVKYKINGNNIVSIFDGPIIAALKDTKFRVLPDSEYYSLFDFSVYSDELPNRYNKPATTYVTDHWKRLPVTFNVEFENNNVNVNTFINSQNTYLVEAAKRLKDIASYFYSNNLSSSIYRTPSPEMLVEDTNRDYRRSIYDNMYNIIPGKNIITRYYYDSTKTEFVTTDVFLKFSEMFSAEQDAMICDSGDIRKLNKYDAPVYQTPVRMKTSCVDYDEETSSLMSEEFTYDYVDGEELNIMKYYSDGEYYNFANGYERVDSGMNHSNKGTNYIETYPPAENNIMKPDGVGVDGRIFYRTNNSKIELTEEGVVIDNGKQYYRCVYTGKLYRPVSEILWANDEHTQVKAKFSMANFTMEVWYPYSTNDPSCPVSYTPIDSRFIHTFFEDAYNGADNTYDTPHGSSTRMPYIDLLVTGFNTPVLKVGEYMLKDEYLNHAVNTSCGNISIKNNSFNNSGFYPGIESLSSVQDSSNALTFYDFTSGEYKGYIVSSATVLEANPKLRDEYIPFSVENANVSPVNSYMNDDRYNFSYGNYILHLPNIVMTGNTFDNLKSRMMHFMFDIPVDWVDDTAVPKLSDRNKNSMYTTIENTTYGEMVKQYFVVKPSDADFNVVCNDVIETDKTCEDLNSNDGLITYYRFKNAGLVDQKDGEAVYRNSYCVKFDRNAKLDVIRLSDVDPTEYEYLNGKIVSFNVSASQIIIDETTKLSDYLKFGATENAYKVNNPNTVFVNLGTDDEPHYAKFTDCRFVLYNNGESVIADNGVHLCITHKNNTNTDNYKYIGVVTGINSATNIDNVYGDAFYMNSIIVYRDYSSDPYQVYLMEAINGSFVYTESYDSNFMRKLSDEDSFIRYKDAPNVIRENIALQDNNGNISYTNTGSMYTPLVFTGDLPITIGGNSYKYKNTEFIFTGSIEDSHNNGLYNINTFDKEYYQRLLGDLYFTQ